jgi:signal transduction histidine kinase
MNEYLKKVTKTINSVRYGNLSARLEDAAGYEELTASINRMIEALSDREKMIVEYRNELQHSLDREKEFVAALTHDLKVPIIAQNNVVDFLLEGRFGEVTEPQRTALQNIQTSGRELLKLVQTLLETHKEHGVVKEKIDLKPFIDRIIDEMRPATGALKITTVHKCKRVDADPLALERVLKNLISNAILHGQADVEVRTSASKGFVKICVIDFGQGISPADAPHIFDKFYHAGKKRLSTGLGLYLSQQIVRAHGGEITLNCKKGTEFCIKLPC